MHISPMGMTQKFSNTLFCKYLAWNGIQHWLQQHIFKLVYFNLHFTVFYTITDIQFDFDDFEPQPGLIKS